MAKRGLSYRCEFRHVWRILRYIWLRQPSMGLSMLGPCGPKLEGLVTDTIVMSKRESLPLRNVTISVLLCEPGKGAAWIPAAVHICLISSRTALCLAMFAPELLQYLR